LAKKLKVGDVLQGYRITKVFGPGMMAISYGAVSPSGQKVFLKQYKSPAPTVVWYPKFLEYQHELSSRVKSTRAGHFAVRQLDAFEEEWGGRCYFQAYEFVENGADLQHILDQEREDHARTGKAPVADPPIWGRHVTWAKVLTTGIASLHSACVIHADLKPANAYLIADPTIGAGYQLKLIDMDFSILADRRAPWHGFQGYVGSDNYRSPEHLTRGGVPDAASDVFTTGLILFELLAGYHPYWHEDQAEYARQVKAYTAKPPHLVGILPKPATNVAVSAVLHRCLSPNQSERPTADELGSILKGLVAGATGTSTTRTIASTVPSIERKSATIREPLVSQRIALTAAGRSVEIGVRTELGREVLKVFGSDAEFWDNRQCVLERDTQNRWILHPVVGTTNETLLNGNAVTAPRYLYSGDEIAVGREAKGVVKLPITVRNSRDA
jgi:eukaryotic-like serine/threonine-protein kinase